VDELDPIIESLRQLGTAPIDPATASRHLGAMVGIRPRASLATKVKVGAAFAAGLLVGGTGLATAGALPGPAQDVAHSALSEVGVSVPGGPQRYEGPECGGTYKNHGQYVRAHPGDPNAGRSPCGKPLQSTTGAGSGDQEAPGYADGGPGSNGHGNGHGQGHGHGHGHGQGGAGQSAPEGQSNPSNGTGPSSAPSTPVAPTASSTTLPTSTSTPSTTSTSTSTTSTTSTTTSTTVG
jgi:hypothetical protein